MSTLPRPPYNFFCLDEHNLLSWFRSLLVLILQLLSWSVISFTPCEALRAASPHTASASTLLVMGTLPVIFLLEGNLATPFAPPQVLKTAGTIPAISRVQTIDDPLMILSRVRIAVT